MGPYPPRLPPAPRTPANQRSASGVGASAPCREVSTLRITVSSPVRRIFGDGRVSDPEMGSLPPRVRRVALRTLANQRSTSGVGFPHRARRYCPSGSPLSSRVCWVHGCMEGLMIRRWDPILPGCCWLSEAPPISGQRWGWVSILWEAASAGRLPCLSPVG